MTEAKNLAKTYVYTNHRERSHSILSHSSRMPPPHPTPPGDAFRARVKQSWSLTGAQHFPLLTHGLR